MRTKLSDSRLSAIGAQIILNGFSNYTELFNQMTLQAAAYFEQRDWAGSHHQSKQRLQLYRHSVNDVITLISEKLDDRLMKKMIWAGMKAVYSALIAEKENWELAETYFNSICRRVFSTVGVDPRIEFIDTDFDTPLDSQSKPIFNRYEGYSNTRALVEEILLTHPHAELYGNLGADAQRVANRISKLLKSTGMALPNVIEILKPVFYRDRSAILVGRALADGRYIPLVLSLRHQEKTGVFVDAVLIEEDAVSILFSFTRNYFQVEALRPYEIVEFLSTILPKKRIAELYIAIGANRHGKTELYRDMLQHLETTEEQFLAAPGIAGMVMIVFTLPSYHQVFKVIRDRFERPKTLTRETVLAKYKLVFGHDRAGRLIDAQQFEHIELNADRFSPALLAELLDSASQTVSLSEDGSKVIINHLYAERKVTPLNLYIRSQPRRLADAAIVDWGRCIKQLAVSNIFPGDLLQKNFGVTRHGRVVFYDYDELCHLTEVRFLFLPIARTEEEAWSVESRFMPTTNDIFPAEFSNFLGLAEPLRSVFESRHSDLYHPKYWREIQARLLKNEIPEILPYYRHFQLLPTKDK